MKKSMAIVLSILMVALAFSGCATSTTTSLEGKHVFMFKSTGNTFGDLMYEGFSALIKAKGGEAVNKSPAETTVSAQVKLIDELITQKVASITISTNGDTGYDEVFAKAKKAGIKIVSVDSKASADYRVTHIDPTSQAGIGQSLVQAGVLIALGVDYPTDGNIKAACETALASYTGEEIKLGVLSASIDTPVQNGWIAKMEEELTRDVYKGKVSATLDKKYGNDDPTVSTTQANAFISENKVDVIISPTTVGMAAAGQALTTATTSKIKLTGLGLPSEMQNFMPKKSTDKAFDFVCPYMMLWDVIDLGRVAGAAAWAACNDGYDGKIGSTIKLDAVGEYSARTLSTIQHPDDTGTLILVGNPYTFYKGNMETWIPKL